MCKLERHYVRESPVREVCAFGEVLAGCALKFAVCVMTVSKGVVNGYVG